MNELEKIRSRYTEYKDLSDEDFVDKISKVTKDGKPLYPNLSKRLKALIDEKKSTPKIKDAKDVVACICDYGYFISLARTLAKTYKKVYYHSPIDGEYVDIDNCVFGKGFKEIERLDNPLHPDALPKIDLFIFPDIGYASLQRHLREIGRAVWGSFDATELELYRTLFLEQIKKLGLPYAPYKVVQGVTALGEHLKTVKDKWIKIDRYRKSMETWHHIDYEHSQRELERLAIVFGGVKEEIIFVVQDTIKTDYETGSDTWCIDGKYPSYCFQGYEDKNELYLASLTKTSSLASQITDVNNSFAPIFKKFGYRNFMATEIRVKDKKPYFIDPTFRMPGMSGEHILETCSNLAEVIWNGANGIFVEPIFRYKFAAVTSAHYMAGEANEWGTVRVPKEIDQWVKFSHCCIIDGMYHFPPGDKLDLGVVIGVGNTIKEALNMLKKNTDALKDEPISFKIEGFFDILKSIREAEKNGIKFSNEPIPSDEEILKYTI
jgi:hypothetical protein